MSTVVYDAAVLVGADRNERRAWAEHKVRLEPGVVPLVPVPVVVQVSRSPQQAQLRRFLGGCVVLPLGEAEAHEAGRLLGLTKTADVVDAVVLTTALRQKATIITGDPDDIERLVGASGREIAVVAIWGIANTIRNAAYLQISLVGPGFLPGAFPEKFTVIQRKEVPTPVRAEARTQSRSFAPRAFSAQSKWYELTRRFEK